MKKSMFILAIFTVFFSSILIATPTATAADQTIFQMESGSGGICGEPYYYINLRCAGGYPGILTRNIYVEGLGMVATENTLFFMTEEQISYVTIQRFICGGDREDFCIVPDVDSDGYLTLHQKCVANQGDHFKIILTSKEGREYEFPWHDKSLATFIKTKGGYINKNNEFVCNFHYY